MQQVFICRQGHSWQADPGAMPGEPGDLPHCPVCGEPTETTGFQELTLGAGPVASANNPGETTAFQDLASQKADAAAPQFSLAPPITAFQDLGGTKENGDPSRPRLPPENVEFQELPARTGDNTPATNASGEPVAPGLDRSTGVTVRFPGLRREVLARPVPALPGYDILAEIGRSATSIVYQARETSRQRIVALKIITAGEYASTARTSWLRAELEAVARLEHPCIVRVYEVGEHAGRIHIAMEYVDGGTLEQKIHGKPQSASMAAQMAETLARTIVYVHERKLVHRNLRPGNILLTSEGTPRISDF